MEIERKTEKIVDGEIKKGREKMEKWNGGSDIKSH